MVTFSPFSGTLHGILGRNPPQGWVPGPITLSTKVVEDCTKPGQNLAWLYTVSLGRVARLRLAGKPARSEGTEDPGPGGPGSARL